MPPAEGDAVNNGSGQQTPPTDAFAPQPPDAEHQQQQQQENVKEEKKKQKKVTVEFPVSEQVPYSLNIEECCFVEVKS